MTTSQSMPINPASWSDNYLKTTVELVMPRESVMSDVAAWASALQLDSAWMENASVQELDLPQQHEALFLRFYLAVLRYFYEWARIPIFEKPRIFSLVRDASTQNKCTVGVKLQQLDHIPGDVHYITIQAALRLSLWMAKNSPSPVNIHKIFDAITQKVIEPVNKILPMGKSTIPLLKMARQLGIPFEYLGLGIYRLGWGSKSRLLDRSSCELDSVMGAKLAQNKALTAHMLRAAGLPSAVHQVVTTEKDALLAAAKIRFPLVVKPVDLDRGEGVSTNISNEDELKTAFDNVRKLSKSKEVIVERQVPGVCHRFFVANHKVLYVIKRNPISVTGDGKSTVKALVEAQLIEQSKTPPWDRSPIKPIDDLARKCFAKVGLTEDSIPEKGLAVPLRPIQSNEWGGSPQDVSKLVHADNLKIALDAVNLFKLNIGGIDVISPDISRPWHENGAIINEVNFAPLFGGAEISRSYIPKFFAEFIDGNGKIPVEAFESEDAAAARQQAFRQQGVRCYLLTATKTLDPGGHEIVLPMSGMRLRLRALACRSDVDAIVFCQSS